MSIGRGTTDLAKVLDTLIENEFSRPDSPPTSGGEQPQLIGLVTGWHTHSQVR
jgi:hypothetical protein